jgi:hypothetical protein
MLSVVHRGADVRKTAPWQTRDGKRKSRRTRNGKNMKRTSVSWVLDFEVTA